MGKWNLWGSTSPIADVTLSAPAASIGLSNLNLANYSLVRIVAILRCSVGATGSTGNWERAMLRFNGDTTAANYEWAVENSDTSNVNNGSAGYVAGIEFGHMAGPNIAANGFAQNLGDLIFPGDSTRFKSMQTRAGTLFTGGVALATFGTGYWLNTSPITSITIVPNEAQNIVAGSRLMLLPVA